MELKLWTRCKMWGNNKARYAIVLDRGVSGAMVDLLKESNKSKSPVRTVNGVTFDIVRYGY